MAPKKTIKQTRPKPMSPKAGYKPRVGKKKTRYGNGGALKKKQS